MNEDPIDAKLIEAFPACVVRKDLLHNIKKGTNVPSFVLEFLLSKFCATDDPEEIDAGTAAVVETIQKNYVRADESNRAQSLVQQKGRHKFIDKIHVNYIEREKKHWAAMENFNSRRIEISERFYRNNERILEGGIWAEVTLGHTDSPDEDYAFYVEDLRPIQLSRFDFEEFREGRKRFTRDEWMTAVLRSMGLEPGEMTPRLRLHFLARLIPFVEANYNFIELGPRGTGKSYAFSEFSPYSTLISGGQASTSVLFYNNQRRRVGIIGFWDVVAFDEVGGMKVRDPHTIQIMKDYMANGRFSRGVEVIADASLAFLGNIDDSIEQLVRSPNHDLFKPLPDSFDLAVIHRLHNYLPGWEIPASHTELLTDRFGFITDYLTEAFHHMAKHQSRFAAAKKRAKLGADVRGRDETAVCKTVAGFLKLLHPDDEPTDEEFEEYLAYALEGRLRVKEQLHKRKPDGEFGELRFTFTSAAGKEVQARCPESEGITETSESTGAGDGRPVSVKSKATVDTTPQKPTETREDDIPDSEQPPQTGAEEKHYRIRYGDRGHSCDTIFLPYFQGAKTVKIEDPYIRLPHQIVNFQRFCETCVKAQTVRRIELVTGSEHQEQEDEVRGKLYTLADSLKDFDIELSVRFENRLHDREVRTDNGWCIKIGRGLDFYQKPDDWMDIGAQDPALRPCLDTTIDVFKDGNHGQQDGKT